MRLITTFTNERGEAYTVLQLLKRLRNAIIQIDEILWEHLQRIETLEEDVAQIKQDILEIRQELEDIKVRIDDIEDRLDGIDIRLDEIDDRIDGIDALIVTMQTAITTINSQIVTINDTLTEHTDNLNDLSTQITVIQSSITTISEQTTDIKTDISDIQTQIDSIPIVSASSLNGYIKINGVDTLVYDDDGGGGTGTETETFKSNKSLLNYKQLGLKDYGVYRNVFKYLVGNEINEPAGRSVLRYIFRYPCVYGVAVYDDDGGGNDIDTTANFQVTIGAAQLDFGEMTFPKDAKNKSFNLECELRITRWSDTEYDISALLRFYTADPELGVNNTLIKTLFASLDTGAVIAPYDRLRLNVMLQNHFLNIGWFQCDPSNPPVTSGSWYGILETDAIDTIFGSD